MELYGKIVKLRAVEFEDLELLRQLTNDPTYEEMIVGWSFPISKREQIEWYEKEKGQNTVIRYIIETEKDGMVGMIGLKDIDWKNGVASGAGMRIIRKEFKSKGIATDAWMTLLKYAFNELRLNRINGCALDYNKASLRVTEKVGFKVEGIQRQAIYKNGRFNDLIMLGILKEDYERNIDEIKYWEKSSS